MEFLQVLQSFFKGTDEVVGSLRLNYHIVDVGLYILPDLVLEALLDSLLVGCTSVFLPKGHGGVAIGIEDCDEQSFDLVLLI